MPQTTPFHPRLDTLNQPRIWEHWSGYLAAPRYQYSTLNEYYAIRNSAALFDTSPLFKYRLSGDGVHAFLQQALVRDIRECAVGCAQYTAWCNIDGFVVEDGVILHPAKDEYQLTAAEPNLRYFRKLARELGVNNVEIEDISKRYGLLALQGPHSATVLRRLTDAIDKMPYFGLAEATIVDAPVLISRTGFTGDLGYELWIDSADALQVWDALMQAGADYNITPMGLKALHIARIEAGLLLLDVDFHSARFAWVDAQRETPNELGWGWMLRKLADDERNFIGRDAIEFELAGERSRWTTVGLTVDWNEYERVHDEAGIMPPKDGVIHEGTMSLYRRGSTQYDYAGYATSFLYSPILKRHIAIAKLPLDLAIPGSEVDLELTVIRKPQYLKAQVTKLPFYNPPRKTRKVRG